MNKGLTQSEYYAHRWLIKGGLTSNRILVKYPDFMDARTSQFYEVKLITTSIFKQKVVVFHPGQIEEFSKIDPLIIIMTPKQSLPISVIPMSELLKNHLSRKVGENVYINFDMEEE